MLVCMPPLPKSPPLLPKSMSSSLLESRPPPRSRSIVDRQCQRANLLLPPKRFDLRSTRQSSPLMPLFFLSSLSTSLVLVMRFSSRAPCCQLFPSRAPSHFHAR
ncbi:hypothetical protein GUJ93_ZPchr0004g38476 [Zizania palustris]|uniref:Uncharacterized protein n=1 Tax=Zizania palustris TaxID=103762 RepID=A0A8J5SAT4_ZIZPA|nr:hypothetical protein GUJ93_ZPchr0004g38476 [Zizania palustris]